MRNLKLLQQMNHAIEMRKRNGLSVVNLISRRNRLKLIIKLEQSTRQVS